MEQAHSLERILEAATRVIAERLQRRATRVVPVHGREDPWVPKYVDDAMDKLTEFYGKTLRK